MEKIVSTTVPGPAGQQARPGRNMGIDCLRLLSMFYVMLLHTLGQGGVLAGTTPGSPQYMIAWLLRVLAYGAVDTFALISGYVGYSDQEKRHNYANLLLLWLQVVAYGIAVTLFFMLVRPDIASWRSLVTSLFPVSFGTLWYFTDYVVLFLVMPWLNAALRQCPKRSLMRLAVLIFIVFSCWDTVIQRFGLDRGYTFLWLALLYVLGAAVKKCQIGANMKPWQAFLGIALCGAITWGWKMLDPTWTISSATISGSLFASYTSPTVLVASILYLIGFSKLEFPPAARRVIAFAAPCAFAAFILNCQKYVWLCLKNRFTAIGQHGVTVVLLHSVLFSLAFLVIAILIDRVRLWCFRVLGIRKLADRCAACIDRLLAGKERQDAHN